MYSTCLFCNRPFGLNEALEHFPVGRRLAFDPAKGRLWVVCEHCERWSLSPLETRWEAIEEADRVFRGAPLRLNTDHIGLAQLSEGLELVRLGSPPRLELAAWRYGDQFGRRRRTAIGWGALAAVGVIAPAVIGPLLGIGLLGTGIGLVYQTKTLLTLRSNARRIRFVVKHTDDARLALTNSNANCVSLIPVDGGEDWALRVPHRTMHSPKPGGLVSRAEAARTREITLTGPAAHRLLATILPFLNRGGGSERRVREAVDVIAETASVDRLLGIASVNTEAKKTHVKLRDGESTVSVLPARLRLALEMVLHEQDERRAMEGELHELEQRWREAEEIAAIADALLVPHGVEERMTDLRSRV